MKTKLFHTIVIVGSGLLAGCGGKGHPAEPPHSPSGSDRVAAPDGGAPPPPPVDAPAKAIDQPPPPPRIHAFTPEKAGLGPPPPPPRVHAVKPPPKLPQGGQP